MSELMGGMGGNHREKAGEQSVGWKEGAPGLARAHGLVIINPLCWGPKAEEAGRQRQLLQQSINQSVKQTTHHPRDTLLMTMMGREGSHVAPKDPGARQCLSLCGKLSKAGQCPCREGAGKSWRRKQPVDGMKETGGGLFLGEERTSLLRQ